MTSISEMIFISADPSGSSLDCTYGVGQFSEGGHLPCHWFPIESLFHLRANSFQMKCQTNWPVVTFKNCMTLWVSHMLILLVAKWSCLHDSRTWYLVCSLTLWAGWLFGVVFIGLFCDLWCRMAHGHHDAYGHVINADFTRLASGQCSIVSSWRSLSWSITSQRNWNRDGSNVFLCAF